MPRGRGHGPRMSNEKAKDFKGTMKKLMAYLSTYKIGIFFLWFGVFFEEFEIQSVSG